MHPLHLQSIPQCQRRQRRELGLHAGAQRRKSSSAGKCNSGEHWREVVIATAFRTDSLQAVQSQRDALAELRGSRWPAASVPWPGA
ncbi:hypothetical protein [Microbacterium sp. NPDC080220]|uniref:hypothetical protein n=1 Tax=Microbacterium sp. NPDC080220 TaxID=3161017 RepID=UPI003444A10B